MALNQDDKRIIQNSIEFLHRISSFLKTPALKSIYNTKSRLMELRQGLILPSSLTKASVKCQRCLLNFHDGPARYSIKKSQKLNKFAKKLKSKEQNGKPLTAYQRKFLKTFKYHEGNTLVIKCKFCDKEASLQLQKPKKVKPLPLNTPKKKKKRKDKSCGLNKDVLRSVAPSKEDSVIVIDETLVQTSQYDKSVIVLEDSFAETPKKAKKVVTSVSKKSMLARGSHIAPKNKNNNSMNRKSMLSKDSPRMPNNKIVLKANKNKVKKKAIDTREAKKKKKTLSKLGSLLKDSDKKSPSSNLKHFLQSL